MNFSPRASRIWAHLGNLADARQLDHVTLDRGTHVVPEPSRPLAACAALHLRVTAGADPIQQLVSAEESGSVRAERGRPLERAVDEQVVLAADLALGEGP
jgi:hypothetical protein